MDKSGRFFFSFTYVATTHLIIHIRFSYFSPSIFRVLVWILRKDFPQNCHLSIYNSLTLYVKNWHQQFFTFWEFRLLFTISWRGPHKKIPGFLFWGLKFGRYGVLWKKMSNLSQFLPSKIFFWHSELLSDPICPFSTCRVKLAYPRVQNSIYTYRNILNMYYVSCNVSE